jgi:hypothetical protein
MLPRMSRVIVRIEVSADAFAKVQRVTERGGRTQLVVMSRLVEWVADQDEEIIGAILGSHLDGRRGAGAKLIADRMLKGKLSSQR